MILAKTQLFIIVSCVFCYLRVDDRKQVEPPGYFEDFSPRADNFIFESFVTKLGTHKLYVDAKLPRVLDVPILIIF